MTLSDRLVIAASVIAVFISGCVVISLIMEGFRRHAN